MTAPLSASRSTLIPVTMPPFFLLTRCLFSRPGLLGDPRSLSSPPPFTKKDLESGAEEGRADEPNESPLAATTTTISSSRSSSVGVGVPVSMVVRAVRTLTSPPFLQRAGSEDFPEIGQPRVEGQGGSGGDGAAAIPTRLQLAAVSALRALVSGQGPGYVVRAIQAAMAAGGEAGAGVVGAVEELDGEEAGQADAGKLLLGFWCRFGFMILDMT